MSSDPLKVRIGLGPGTGPAALIATGWPHARSLIESYVAAGLSRFVVRPAAGAGGFGRFLDGFREHLMPLQT